MTGFRCDCGAPLPPGARTCADCATPHPSATLPPAGWFIDQNAPGHERWWDGSAWTELRRQASLTAPTASVRQHAPGSGRRAAPSAVVAMSRQRWLPWFIGAMAFLVFALPQDWIHLSVDVDQSVFGGYHDAQTLKSVDSDESWLVGSVPDVYLFLGAGALFLVVVVRKSTPSLTRAWAMMLAGPSLTVLLLIAFVHLDRFIKDALEGAGIPSLEYAISWRSGFWTAAVGCLLACVPSGIVCASSYLAWRTGQGSTSSNPAS